MTASCLFDSTRTVTALFLTFAASARLLNMPGREGKCIAASAKRAVVFPVIISWFWEILVVRKRVIHWWQCSMLFVDGEVAISNVNWM